MFENEHKHRRFTKFRNDLNFIKSAFSSNGYRGYTSQEAQKKFADSLLNIADKLFWAPLAVLGVMLYELKAINVPLVVFAVVFLGLGLILRHSALKVYDEHAEDNERKEQLKKMKNPEA